MSNKIDCFSGDNRYLSNFWKCDIYYQGLYYTTVEHAYQAAKTLDEDLRKKISLLDTAGEAKGEGQALVKRDDWKSVKEDIMYQLVKLKFFENWELADRLLETGDKEIVEGNTWGDTFWGVCDGVGENKLGEILSRVRDELKDNKEKKQ